jgi:hypothetical protein
VVDTAGLEEAAPASLTGRMQTQTGARSTMRMWAPHHRCARGCHRSRSPFRQLAAAQRQTSRACRQQGRRSCDAARHREAYRLGLGDRCRSRPSMARVWPSFRAAGAVFPIPPTRCRWTTKRCSSRSLAGPMSANPPWSTG